MGDRNAAEPEGRAENWPNAEARAVLDGMSDHFVALDRAYVLTFVNRALAESRPAGTRPLLGRSLWDLWPEMRGSVVEASLARALELKLPVSFEYHHERSGRWLAATAHPHGDLLHVFFRDVTQARNDEAERGEREARLQAMVDSMPQIAWSTDAKMVVNHLNRRWREYTGAEGASPGEVAKVVHPDDLPSLSRLAERAAALGESLEGEARLRRSDGQYRLHLVRMAPFHNAEGLVAGWIGTSTDVHDVRAADLRLAAVADAVPAFVGFVDANRVYRFANRHYEEWLGRPRAQVVGRHMVDALGREAYERVRSHLDRALAGERVDFEHWIDYPVGRRYVRGTYVPAFGEGGKIEGVSITVLDETATREAEEALRAASARLEALAATDFLTGLWNARVFHERLQEEWEAARRLERPLSLALLDLDEFKGYNDQFGHSAGDEALRAAAGAARKETRNYDVVARLGGEEFGILMPSTDGEQAMVVAERVRGAVAAGPWPLRVVTTSIGVAARGPDTGRAEELFKAADRALYGAKSGGRDRVLRAAPDSA